MIIYTPCYNEMPWTPFFLRHLLDFDCPIIISEGASECRQKNSDRSWDGSWELIQMFQERWKDRVTVVLHEYGLTIKNQPVRPRAIAKLNVWNDAPDGEWIVGLAPDNIYRKSDIKKIKQTCEDATDDDFLLMTGQRVFNFNFKTIATHKITNLCGSWLSLWPCIWRKNKHFILTYGNELLTHCRTRKRLVNADPLQFHIKLNPYHYKRHVIFKPDIQQFHYKNVKKYTNRVQRWSNEKAITFKNYSLNGKHLEQYDGTHPAILDTHPWRHVKDCRMENPIFDWQDYTDIILKP